MGYVGEYIHYRATMYNQFGIHRSNGSNDWTTSWANQRNHLKNLTNNNQKDDERCRQLAAWYQNLYYGDLLTTPLSIDDSSADTENILAQTILEIINESDDNRVNAGSSNWTLSQLNSALNRPNNALIKNTGFTGAKIGNKVALTTLDKAIEGLERAYKKAAEAPAHQGQGKDTINIRDAELSVDQLKTQIEYLIKAIQQVENSIQHTGKSKWVSNLSSKTTGYQRGNLKNKANLEFTNFRELLLYVQDVLKVFQGNGAFLIAGPASEVAAVAKVVYQNAMAKEVNDGANRLTKDTLKTLVKNALPSMWMGNQGGPLVYANKLSYSMVDEDDLLPELGLGYKREGEGYSIVYDPSGDRVQGTVDVTLTPDLDSELGKIIDSGNRARESISVSQKVYSNVRQSGIHLVQKTPLLTLLLTGYFLPDFTNHYLNLIGLSNRSEFQVNKEYQSEKLVYWGAALRGFMGINQKNEFLMINDKTTRTVHVASMNILNRMLENNYNNLNQIITITKSYAGETSHWNEFVDNGNGLNALGAQARITKYLAAVNTVKLTVQLKGNAAMQL